MIRAEQLHARIMDELDMTREVGDEELTQLIYQVLSEASREEHLSLAEKTALGKDLFNAFVSWIFYRSFWRMTRLRRL